MSGTVLWGNQMESLIFSESTIQMGKRDTEKVMRHVTCSRKTEFRVLQGQIKEWSQGLLEQCSSGGNTEAELEGE
jgi:hypothetical protein